MCLFLDILWLKKRLDLRWVGGGGKEGMFPYHSKYFPLAEDLELLFVLLCSTILLTKTSEEI